MQNLDPASAGYGDYLWFGVTLYDDRDVRPGLYVAGDAATGKLIYNIGLAPLSPSGLGDGAWHAIEGDLLPHLLAALREAWARGLLTDSMRLSDYRIGGMNIGWEVPGLNTVELQVEGLSLVYETASSGGGGSGGGGGGTAAPVRYAFDTDGDREGWTTRNVDDWQGGPRGGLWVVRVPGNDPMFVGPAVTVDASRYRTLRLRVANDGNPADASRMQIFWRRRGAPDFSEPNSVWVELPNDGGWRTFTVDLGAQAGWRGTIERLRIDPVVRGNGRSVGLDFVELLP